MPAPARKHILAEPVGRSTAAAIALAAIHIRHEQNRDALMAILPADLYIGQPQKYRKISRLALDLAREPGRMVVLGIPPTRPDTGFGYIQCAAEPVCASPSPFFLFKLSRKSPSSRLLRNMWHPAITAGTRECFSGESPHFSSALKKYLPKTSSALEILAETIGTRSYERKLRSIYPRLENIAVDYAILEAATREKGIPRVFVIPASMGWSDIGSWTAVYEQSARDARGNALSGPGFLLDADGNFIWSPSKFIGAIGISDLVVVDTPDALLICPRDRSQDVGKIVKYLETQRKKQLL